MDLTLIDTANNFKSKAGNVGTLLTFDEKHKKGEHKDKNIVGWSADASFVPEQLTGFTYDEENERIHFPLISKQVIRRGDREHDLRLIHELGMDIRL